MLKSKIHWQKYIFFCEVYWGIICFNFSSRVVYPGSPRIEKVSVVCGDRAVAFRCTLFFFLWREKKEGEGQMLLLFVSLSERPRGISQSAGAPPAEKEAMRGGLAIFPLPTAAILYRLPTVLTHLGQFSPSCVLSPPPPHQLRTTGHVSWDPSFGGEGIHAWKPSTECSKTSPIVLPIFRCDWCFSEPFCWTLYSRVVRDRVLRTLVLGRVIKSLPASFHADELLFLFFLNFDSRWLRADFSKVMAFALDRPFVEEMRWFQRLCVSKMPSLFSSELNAMAPCGVLRTGFRVELSWSLKKNFHRGSVWGPWNDEGRSGTAQDQRTVVRLVVEGSQLAVPSHAVASRLWKVAGKGSDVAECFPVRRRTRRADNGRVEATACCRVEQTRACPPTEDVGRRRCRVEPGFSGFGHASRASSGRGEQRSFSGTWSDVKWTNSFSSAWRDVNSRSGLLFNSLCPASAVFWLSWEHAVLEVPWRSRVLSHQLLNRRGNFFLSGKRENKVDSSFFLLLKWRVSRPALVLSRNLENDQKQGTIFVSDGLWIWSFRNAIWKFGSRSFIPLHVIFAMELFWNNAKTYFENAEPGFIDLLKHSDLSLGQVGYIGLNCVVEERTFHE